MDENSGDITQARPYQDELLNKAIERNTIVYLPTGTGKTYIAVMLVKELSSCTEISYSNGGKRSIFLAPNVPLVSQQAEYFRRHTSLKVECYFGEKKINDKVIDLWDENIWNRELENNQLLVMTPKILLDMVAHSFIDLNRINLLIFDECHRAVGLHDYSQILRFCRDFDPAGKSIRILGLTACVVQTKCDLSEFNAQFKKLEDNFNCKIETILVESDDIGINTTALFKKPQIKMLTYKNDDESNSQIVQRLNEVLSKLKELEKKYEKSFVEKEVDSIATKRQTDNIYKYMKKEFTDLLMVLNELGLFCFKEAFKSFKESVNLKLSLLAIEDNELLAVQNLVDSLKIAFDFLLNHYLPDNEDKESENIFQNSSVKVRCLMDIYAQRNDCFDKDFHSIIFVNQRKIANSLSELFNKISQMDKFSFIKASYVVGTNGSEDSMNQNKQKIELDKFRRREVNVLVATNVIEEGIDVPSCNMVIRFSKPNNFCSFIQSKGRARSNESHYYLIVEESEVDDFETELTNFLAIENDIQYKLIKTRNEIMDETIDDVEYLNSLIPPLKKGNSELTCMKALELINRWVSTLQRESCCKLYPFYDFEEFKEDIINSSSLYKCTLWLPPNPIINKEIESEKFKRKKYAKMHAALLACKELDNAGQLTSNLLLITENEWIKPHIELDEDIKEKFEKADKIKKYQIEVVDELKRNHPMANTNLHLYKIALQDSSSANLIDNSFELGYLSSKLIEDLPEFLLYKNDIEISVKLTRVSNSIILNQDEINLLRKANESIFTDMLRFKSEFDFESSLYGGLIVILSPNGTFGDSQIEWETIRSLKLVKENFNTYRKIYPEKHDMLLRMNASRETIQNDAVRNQTNRVFMLVKVHDDMNPFSQFVTRKAKNFKEYFLNKYQLETTDLEQPLIELKHIETSFNYLSKTQSTNQNKVQEVKHKEIFIGEHFLVLPFEKKYLFAFSLLPCIFHRINSLLKASHLKTLIENSIASNWNIKAKKVATTWNSSLKFNKTVKPNQQDNSSDSDSESEDNQYKELCYRRDKEEDEASETTIPDLLIKDYSGQEELEFPSTYAILQCLTLKSAHENFDLERYEILGDCFLKLVVILRIYVKFGSTNEGNMASLKSLRVSNKYLFKLAQKKNLHHYINSACFQPRVNWILPNEAVNENDVRLNMQFNFKSLADSIEALIGCYLMHLGTKGGKECIRWLNFEISNQDDMIDFNEDLPLPNPLLASKLPDSINLNELEKFAKTLNYKFNNPVYLFQAFTHPSYLRNRYTASYQKLELIGDAVLDILVTQYIFADKKEYSPGELTNLRQSLVNNKFFAFLAVKYNFHNYMKYDSPSVYNSINEYAKMHETCPPDFSFLDRKACFESLAQNGLDEYDIETPKFLADIFESVAGAIYLDSNCSLEAVWRVYYPLMKLYLIEFKKNPPVSPIVALNTLKPHANFKISYEEEDVEKVAVLKGDDKEFSAKAKTKSLAKLKVFKQAVRFYDPERKIIFF